MLNTKTYYKYHNNQYNELDKDGKKWIVRPEMSIFFEPDGPYKCMVLPAAKEEGKTLKKRYIVITKEGKMSELKGFELKRRGELKIIKIFQADVFKQFLKGNNLKECYNECAVVAKRWYSILQLHGKGISDEELLEYIEESRNMSKSVEEYGAQKSTAITCAKRMADILGEQLLKEKNLCSKFIISRKPFEAPIAERAIPTIIFKSQDNIRKKLLRKWLKDYTLEENVDMREVIDWDYYKERLAGNILKIVIIPAAIQRIENPFPDIAYPDWVSRMMARKIN
jgi:DNA polymerase epsilon subunit 1